MRTVVITGGHGGIGKAVAKAFAGDRVLAPGRAECDVTDEDSVRGYFAQLDTVDVLVNNAGTSGSAPLSRTTLAEWRQQWEVNAAGSFLCTREVLPGMLARDSGRIVMIASTAGLAGARYTAAYASAKHAAIGLMRVVAAEVAGTGVTANAVCPTFVRTPMTERSIARIVQRTQHDARSAEQALAATAPLGRLVEPDEVAFAVRFLAAPQAGAINGQSLVLDGGGIQ